MSQPDLSPESPSPATPSASVAPHGGGPSFILFGIVAGVGLVLDAVTKAWAEITLSELPRRTGIVLIEDRLTFTLTYNKGGAFGLFSDEADIWRKPFFFIVSLVAVFFIVALYRRVSPEQKTLKWGLPLVLAGALGNVADRITKGKVVDFIDYRADWVQSMNELIQAVNSNWYVSRHWPTFNVADICICVGVGLMALEMFFGSRGEATEAPNPPAGSGSPAS